MLDGTNLGRPLGALIGWAYRRAHRSLFRAGDFPRRVFLELTSVCNLKCPMCPHPTMKRRPGHMTIATAEKAAEELSRLRPPLEYITLHAFGEAVLHPELAALLSMLRRRLPQTSLIASVNLASARCEQIDALFDSGIGNIGVWMDSARKETYETMRAGGNFEKTLAAVDYLLDRKRRSGSRDPLFHIGMIVSRINADQVGEFAAFWRRRLRGVPGVSIVSSRCHNFNGKVDESFALRPRRPYYVDRPCAQACREMVIQSTGDIGLCCLDAEGETAVGNLKDMTLREAWRSPRAEQLRAEMRRSVYRLDVCRHCDGKRLYLFDGRPPDATHLSYEESFTPEWQAPAPEPEPEP